MSWILSRSIRGVVGRGLRAKKTVTRETRPIRTTAAAKFPLDSSGGDGGDETMDESDENIRERRRQLDLVLSWSDGEDPEVDNSDDLVDLDVHRHMLQRYHLSAVGKQNVMVIQPFFRTARRTRDADLALEETLALVDTLGWTTVDSVVAGVNVPWRGELFGSGKIDELSERVRQLPSVSTVVVSSYRLSSTQRINLEEAFGVPVIDRYNLVLQIFQRHAKTKEARIQVGLAEIPYLKRRLHDDRAHDNLRKHSKQRIGEEHFERQEMVLKKRESRAKRQLEAIKANRSVLRKNRFRMGIPTVAVVGYTNCGKTSLIKALTGSDKLKPRDRLFATLDVTVHETRLPIGIKILLIDTVGFISDIPTELIASFSATLEDAALADVLVHVRDVSHPDTRDQSQNVLQTLRNLNLPERLFENMMTVGNKIDKIDPVEWRARLRNDGHLPISATEGFGLDVLIDTLEKKVLQATGRKLVTFRCKMGSEEANWLMSNIAVSKVTADEKNLNYSTVDAVVSDVELAKFRKRFRLA